ncbi:MAG: methionyl-tRNA formyltransferase [Burkholderiales bacterium]|nr:methionyl-tRNA formyltransferase [Anaerolineae bacterium]
MRILFWGKGDRGQACLKRILADGFDVVGVIAQNEESDSGPYLGLQTQAKQANIPCHVLGDLRAEETVTLVRGFDGELFVLAGYARIIPPALVALPPMKIVNLHGGKLPEYRGTAPIPWQIINGETTLGVTILYADEGIDTGDILMEATFEISPEAGATEATHHTLQLFPDMLSFVLRGLRDGSLRGRHQDLRAGSYYTKRQPEDGLLDCRLMSAEYIFNMIRGLRDPYPGAFAYRGAEKVVLQRARLLEENIFGVPGVIPLKRPDGVVLIAGDRGLLLTEVRGEGGKIIPARDVFKVGDRLLPQPTDAPTKS